MQQCEVWLLWDVLFADRAFAALTESEQWERLRRVSDAAKIGDIDFLSQIAWVSLVDPARVEFRPC